MARDKQSSSCTFFKADHKTFDPALAALFSNSSGPVKRPERSEEEKAVKRGCIRSSDTQEDDGYGTSSSHADSEALDQNDTSPTMSKETESDEEAAFARSRQGILNGVSHSTKKKRKRNESDIEEAYMRKLAREEEKEEQQQQKKKNEEQQQQQKKFKPTTATQEDEEKPRVPKHESLEGASEEMSEVEKAGRTVFLSNVPSRCMGSKTAEKALRKHLESFKQLLDEHKPEHKLESLRFRSSAFSTGMLKRAAFAKKEFMDSTTQSTHAYAVYTTKGAAREAVRKLNGSVLFNRHLHVDSVAHPSPVDHRRCVFVGNLPFVDEERSTQGEETGEKKAKAASDAEEGLWVHFATAGQIESVRVVRDAQTRVGKGFGYVQFADENGVEAALQYDGQKFPPMLPRKLRVTRCRAEKKSKKESKKKSSSSSSKTHGPTLSKTQSKRGSAAVLSGEQKSMQGRGMRMVGKVAKAQMSGGLVFEGHRASERQGKKGLKLQGGGGRGQKKGVNGRKSRSEGWKKAGGKK